MKYSQEFYDLMHEVKVVRESLYRELKGMRSFTIVDVGTSAGLNLAIKQLDELIKKWES
jgi:hypothetical protein